MGFLRLKLCRLNKLQCFDFTFNIELILNRRFKMGSAEASSTPYTPFHNFDINESYYLPVQTVVTSNNLHSLASTQFNTALQSSIIPIHSDHTLQSLPNVIHLLAPTAPPSESSTTNENSFRSKIRGCGEPLLILILSVAGIILLGVGIFKFVQKDEMIPLVVFGTGFLLAVDLLIARRIKNACCSEKTATSSQVEELEDQETELDPLSTDAQLLLSSRDPQTSTQNWGQVPVYTRPGYMGNNLQSVYYASSR